MMMRNGQAAETEQTRAELAAKAATLKQQEKKMDHALKRSPPPRAGKTPQALAEQRRSFSNFDPFPIERERERVLAWFQD